MAASNFGWKRLEDEGISITKDIKNIIKFIKHAGVKREIIHAFYNGEKQSICGNYEREDGQEEINQFTPPLKEKLCRNCAKSIAKLQSSDTNDVNVKAAKKTLSKKKIKKPAHKRLERYRQALDKTQEDMLEDIEKTAKTSIELPNEIGPEEHTLNEALSATIPLLVNVRKSAIMNMDRILNEYKKSPPNNPEELNILQQINQLKTLTCSIDNIKEFKSNCNRKA